MWYSPGDIVSVRVGTIRHEGIMTEHGRVISNSRKNGGVFEESTRSFAEGRAIRNHGPLRPADPARVLARARSQIGRAYHPYTHNCEHFVRFCYGKSPYSPQKMGAMSLVALAAAIAAL